MWGDGMSVIQVKCTDQVLKITSAPVLASGGVNEVKVEFDFCEKWDGFLKTALFYRDDGDIYYALLDSNDTCVVPWEVCYSDGAFYFSVFGDKDSVRRTSTTVKYKVKKGVVTESMIPSDPTPAVYDQIVSLVNDYKPSVLTVNLADSTHATHSSDEIEAYFNRGWNVLFAVDYRLLALDRIEGTKAVFLSTYDDGSGVETIEHTIDENKRWSKSSRHTGIMEETDPNVPEWAKQPNKPSYTAQEVGALPDTTQIPVVPSALPNPKKLNFTGAVTANYDGSEEVTVQIPEGGGGGGLTRTLLWENADIYSEFAGQTITLDALQACDAIEILFYTSNYQGGYGPCYLSSGVLPKLTNPDLQSHYYDWGYILQSAADFDSTAAVPSYRLVQWEEDTQITFGNCVRISPGRPESDNYANVPAQIYGIVNGAQYLEVIENGTY
jgi:hypothetical protein